MNHFEHNYANEIAGRGDDDHARMANAISDDGLGCPRGVCYAALGMALIGALAWLAYEADLFDWMKANAVYIGAVLIVLCLIANALHSGYRDGKRGQ